MKPIKRLGQNFLTDPKVIKKVISAADVSSNETILEIGPGTGALTIELAKKAKKVVAVEKDKRMIEVLKENTKDFDNIEIINKDILKTNIYEYKVVANLPFYITNHIIRKLLENSSKGMILIIQKEVAQRICAKPPNMSILAVSVQIYAESEIIDYVSKKSFYPIPEVDSAIIKITPKNRPLPENFFTIVKAGFSQPRKQIINNLSKKLKQDKSIVSTWLLENNIKPEQRAETLSIDDWIRLANNFSSLYN